MSFKPLQVYSPMEENEKADQFLKSFIQNHFLLHVEKYSDEVNNNLAKAHQGIQKTGKELRSSLQVSQQDLTVQIKKESSVLIDSLEECSEKLKALVNQVDRSNEKNHERAHEIIMKLDREFCRLLENMDISLKQRIRLEVTTLKELLNEQLKKLLLLEEKIEESQAKVIAIIEKFQNKNGIDLEKRNQQLLLSIKELQTSQHLQLREDVCTLQNMYQLRAKRISLGLFALFVSICAACIITFFALR